MSISTENFIKNIYALQASPVERLKSSILAERLNISKAAVTDMLRKLKLDGLVHYEKYSAPTLTSKGEKLALSIIRKHRLWETFLNKHLGIPWEKVHQEAELLEHASSDYLTNHLDAFMGYPAFDPHGDPIPDADGNIIEKDKQLLLSKVNETGAYIISRIDDSSEELLKFLKKHKIKPGAKMNVLRISEDNSMTIEHKSKKIKIEKSLCNKLYVITNTHV
jgi:DtxR family Mn-dependent transcriptional regulator